MRPVIFGNRQTMAPLVYTFILLIATSQGKRVFSRAALYL